MRFIDIARLELPLDWQLHADTALGELRNEIERAEATARDSGKDPIAARRAAIAAGLRKSAREKIWQDLAPVLAALRGGKCWYSESRDPTADKNVDHFRPKSRVAEDPSHEGYWWLAFSWRNYRYSSQWCNQYRVDVANGTSGGKRDRFPLCPGSFRARQEGDAIEEEAPELLDPTDPNDWKLLTFRPDGHPTPTAMEGTEEHRRATASIEIYHLHCRELVVGRLRLAGRIQRLVQQLELLRPGIGDRRTLAAYKSLEIELLRAVHPDSEYSAAALAFGKAEVYRLEGGREVRRDWVKEILGTPI